MGERYSNDVLKLKYNGYNIADCLNFSVEQAANFFKRNFKNVLNSLINVGLGYIKLGQSLDTFSGGELQRLN
ncbi:hypothetical protein AX764_05965 [Oenococcus oeni]|nr:hypothetical protein AX764_05965 [Oenococcus oeni]